VEKRVRLEKRVKLDRQEKRAILVLLGDPVVRVLLDRLGETGIPVRKVLLGLLERQAKLEAEARLAPPDEPVTLEQWVERGRLEKLAQQDQPET